ncbi:MAG: hypothetical protein JNK15_25760 [Planctomycetes bacterium]|nr:hypothetical protein [Planctomycetota bacterium]
MNVVPLVVFAVCAATACAQTFTVVPAAHAAADANSHLWLAGAVAPLRQQTLVGASHLQALVGRTLTALEVRRTAANEAFVGGTATMAVTLSITSAAPLAASPTFAANVGPAPVTVFAGSVTLPASPAATSASVAWSPQNTVRIPFATPFVYPGGNLLVDLQGQPIAGMNAPWWMADAVFEDVAGALVTVGTGCGAFGGAPQEWSQADVRTLVLGAQARFSAVGPLGGFGFAAFGSPTSPVPLAALGLPSASPSCALGVWPIDAMLVAPFAPIAASVSFGQAEVLVPIPNHPGLLGASLATQWFEPSQPATSNTIQWTISPALPSLDLTLVEGHAADAAGTVSVHHAPVLRFESQ